jgi:8-oxo-dGTP diphosphatase
MAMRRIDCAGAVIKDGQGRLLLIRRRNEPGAGLWSLPGGRIEPGETGDQAVAREVREETGLSVTVGRLLGVVERPGLDGAILNIRDYLAFVTGGSVHAGDDASAARWVTPGEMSQLDLTDGLTEALASWGVLA